MTAPISPTWVAEKAKQALDLIQQDVADGVYDQHGGEPVWLNSVTVLHDFVDANDYFGEVCGWDATMDEWVAVDNLVDQLLREDPILAR